MNRIGCLVGATTSIVAVTLVFTPRSATATHPADGGPTGVPTVVQRVEIPVPVDDTAADLVQIVVAGAVGAAVATAARRRRDRDLHSPRHSWGGVIDLTETVTPPAGYLNGARINDDGGTADAIAHNSGPVAAPRRDASYR